MIYKHMSDEDVVKQVDEFFKVADADANGEIDYLEWQVATISKFGVLSDEKLREAFKLFDRVSLTYLQISYRMVMDRYPQKKLNKCLDRAVRLETRRYGTKLSKRPIKTETTSSNLKSSNS
jgi:Ca2+-binding EF-hand superfamily protein